MPKISARYESRKALKKLRSVAVFVGKECRGEVALDGDDFVQLDEGAVFRVYDGIFPSRPLVAEGRGDLVVEIGRWRAPDVLAAVRWFLMQALVVTSLVAFSVWIDLLVLPGAVQIAVWLAYWATVLWLIFKTDWVFNPPPRPVRILKENEI
ncbi:hypothetical protein HK107_10755 [Parvularcula sp. ZS-1/3]|uniref:Uncharacterized protein n=1 Tax=Parvularcula mediterranea TaxID=2732508 RepID=A0A7Y3RP37_9PROT|nr:hypothetical protein [Parvularcula mediterranea]NNU16797.1 hypothetical protein [Parvularcula mediterranea]